jgi:hypothetical protein
VPGGGIEVAEEFRPSRHCEDQSSIELQSLVNLPEHRLLVLDVLEYVEQTDHLEFVRKVLFAEIADDDGAADPLASYRGALLEQLQPEHMTAAAGLLEDAKYVTSAATNLKDVISAGQWRHDPPNSSRDDIIPRSKPIVAVFDGLKDAETRDVEAVDGRHRSWFHDHSSLPIPTTT